MNPPKSMSHPRLIGELFVLGILTSIAFAIMAGVACSVARAAPPPQKCPTGTVLNAQTNACTLVKPPTAAAPAVKPATAPGTAPVIAAPPPVHLPVSSGNSKCPAAPNGACVAGASVGAASCSSTTTNSANGSCTTTATAIVASCKSGYYGAQCAACPGGASNACSGNGTCGEGINGTGTCTCYTGFTGPACQTKAPQ